MVSACVVSTVKHEEGGVMMWGWFAGDTADDLLKIQGQHGNKLSRYLMKLFERMPRVCKTVIRAKGDYSEESKI